MSGRVSDQNHTRRHRILDPDIVVRITVAGAGRLSPGDRATVWKRRPVKRLQKSFDRAIADKAVALIQTVGGVKAHPPVPLRKNIESEIVVNADRLLVAWPLRRSVHQKPGQEVMNRIGEPLEPDLTGHGRAAAIGANNYPWRDRIAGTVIFEFDLRRKPGAHLNAADPAKQGSPHGNRSLIENIANPGIPQIQGTPDSPDHSIHRNGKLSGILRRKPFAVWN